MAIILRAIAGLAGGRAIRSALGRARRVGVGGGGDIGAYAAVGSGRALDKLLLKPASIRRL